MPIPSFTLPLAASGAQDASDVYIVAARTDRHERTTALVGLSLMDW